MVEPPLAAPTDDLLFLDFSDDEQNPSSLHAPTPPPQPPSSSAAEQGLRRRAHEEEEEEEELEWLSNKDAFPPLETSFVIPSRTSAATAAPPPSRHSVGAALPPSGVPVRARSKVPRRRRVLLGLGLGFPTEEEAASTESEEKKADMRRKCRHCDAEETPQWRAGPEGPKTLCNACGVRFKSGRLLPEYRPANSPTFSSVLHSNSHRKIIEMRRRGNGRRSEDGDG